MVRAIMWIMAAGALLGALDRILGNRFGLGERFEEAFRLMGPTALSMVGILCLTPLLSQGLRSTLGPVYRALGLDPAMLGGILAIDMGGYPLAMALAENETVGRFAGITVAATLGCTVSFTIPVGMGMLKDEARFDFSRGMLYGLITLTPALWAGGLFSGLDPLTALKQCVPVAILSLLLLIGLRFRTAAMLKGFSVFAALLRIAATAGLALGAVRFMTGVELVPGLAPVEDGMAVAASIGVMMLGSLPVAELLTRALRRPFELLGRRTGLNSASAAGLLMGFVSVLPAVALVPDMDRRGRAVNAACMVCSASALAAHLGFAAGAAETMILPMLAAKLLGGILGASLALFAVRGNISE